VVGGNPDIVSDVKFVLSRLQYTQNTAKVQELKEVQSSNFAETNSYSAVVTDLIQNNMNNIKIFYHKTTNSVVTYFVHILANINLY
jgi:hypothetical protein